MRDIDARALVFALSPLEGEGWGEGSMAGGAPLRRHLGKDC